MVGAAPCQLCACVDPRPPYAPPQRGEEPSSREDRLHSIKWSGACVSRSHRNLSAAGHPYSAADRRAGQAAKISASTEALIGEKEDSRHTSVPTFARWNSPLFPPDLNSICTCSILASFVTAFTMSMTVRPATAAPAATHRTSHGWDAQQQWLRQKAGAPARASISTPVCPIVLASARMSTASPAAASSVSLTFTELRGHHAETEGDDVSRAPR